MEKKRKYNQSMGRKTKREKKGDDDDEEKSKEGP
jgi:hypothetical protein